MISCWVNGWLSKDSKRTLYWLTRLVYTEPVGHTCVPLLLILIKLNLTPAWRLHFSAIAEGCSLLSINRSTPMIFSGSLSLVIIIGLVSSCNGLGVPGLL